jgi:hypothetical protein
MGLGGYMDALWNPSRQAQMPLTERVPKGIGETRGRGCVEHEQGGCGGVLPTRLL